MADVTFHWQFGPGFDSFDASQSTMRGRVGKVRVELTDLDHPRAASRWKSELRRKSMSRAYGEMVPILALAVRSEVLLPARIVTRFRLQPPDDGLGDHYYRDSDYHLFGQILGYKLLKYSVQRRCSAVVVLEKNAT